MSWLNSTFIVIHTYHLPDANKMLFLSLILPVA